MENKTNKGKHKGFFHLHVHTEFSLLDGMNKIKELIRKVKEMGQTALAITDHGVAYGVVNFYNECKEQGIKPIIGCEVYEAPTSRFVREKVDGIAYHHLVLLVKNEVGYKNYCKLISRSNIEGIYYNPRIDFELLEKYHDGLICLSGCLAGRIPTDIKRNNLKKAREDAMRYKKIFGDDFYLEIQNHGIKEEAIVAQELVKLSRELGIKLVCTNDCHYLNSEDSEAHEWLLCIQTKKKLEDEDRMVYTGDYSVKSEEEMRSLFPSLPEAFDNTVEIVEKCTFDFQFAHTPSDYRMPKVVIPEEFGKDYFGYLKYLTYQGLEQRYPKGHPEHTQALNDVEYELGVIQNMGFAEYFLDTLKTIKWSRNHGILVGPGRGSGAGSRVNYCIGITDIDPIKYGLLFERFLNPERISMPDIDVDYQYDRKEDVIRSEAESNGRDKFCKIQTLGSMYAKSVVRDCARVAGYEPIVGNKLAKLIGDSDTLDKAYEINSELRNYIESEESIKKLWSIAKKLEGLKKSSGTHACGHIPTPVPCEDLFPCRVDDESGYLVCQYDMVEAEHLGNLKKDLLMLRNLTVITEAHKTIKEHYGIDIPLWTEEILNDEQALKLFWTGDTDGVFQFESEGMKKFMKDLKPTCFEDIIAGVSLYRPGPMDYIPKYVEGKHNPASITYDCPELEPILKATYGVIVYQEQVMQIVRELAGFSMGRSDLIRKAMGKKKQDIIDAERQNFVYGNDNLNIDGCIKREISEQIANSIYDDMSEFAKYAFNKSHAAAYAAVSMQTAYLKAHYPVEFMAGLLTSVIDNTDKLAPYLLECKEKDMMVRKPDINSSGVVFSANRDGSITYGLLSIKSVGVDIITRIMDEREAKGEYAGIKDLVERVPEVSKGVIEALAKAGALDCFGYSRNTLLNRVDSFIRGLKKEAKKQIEGQLSLFDVCDEMENTDKIEELPELPKLEILAYEKEVTGLYISGHPFEEYMPMLTSEYTNASLFRAEEDKTLTFKAEQKVKIAGMITNMKKIYTKREGKPMAIFGLEDLTGTTKVICFPMAYEEVKNAISENSIVIVKGKTNEEDDGSFSIIAEDVYPISEATVDVYLRFPSMEDYKLAENEIKSMENLYKGKDSIKIYIENPKLVKTERKVINFEQAKEALLNKVGKRNLGVKIV